MFEHSSFSSIKARKRELVKELEAHRREIERFDRAELGGTPIRIEEYYDSSRSIDEIYDDLHCKLQKVGATPAYTRACTTSIGRLVALIA